MKRIVNNWNQSGFSRKQVRRKFSVSCLLFLSSVLCPLSSILHAAEIKFRSPVQCDAATVTLGDVAEVTGKNADMISRTPLFPAPIAGGQKTVTATQIRDLLADRRISSLDHDFRGVTQIVVYGPKKETVKKSNGVNLNAERKTETELTEALVVYLNRCTTDGAPENAIPWKLQLHLTPQQLQAIADGGSITGMYGGKNPLVGRQDFQAELQGINPATGRRMLVRFTADVDLPPRVVVARRSLERGKLLNENDLRIEYRADLKGTDYYSDLNDVIGKATSANLREGAMLTSQSVRKPILVKKGEIVTVVSKNAGVTVTSTAKALEDGAQGDLITLDQQLKTKPEKGRAAIQQRTDSTFVAKVAAIGTVEIFATGNKY